MEGKDNTTQGPYDDSKFEHNFESKTSVLLVIIMETLWVSRRYFIMDIVFGYVPSVVQILKEGLFAMAFI